MERWVLPLALCLVPVSAAAAPKTLEIGQGKFELGGHATVDIYFASPGDGVSATIAPFVGGFITDNVELIGGLDLFVLEDSTAVSFFAGAEYFFPSEYIRPYAGGTLGFGSYELIGVIGSDVFTISGRGGIVLPLNRNVGIDLGGRLDVFINNGEPGLHIPIGYLGVRAFFP
jgi:hypothetical protein